MAAGDSENEQILYMGLPHGAVTVTYGGGSVIRAELGGQMTRRSAYPAQTRVPCRC